MKVKVCGLTREEDVEAAVEAGADFVGFICGFPESPRNISFRRARELITTVPQSVESVLVTTAALVSASPEEVMGAGPAVLQLYGHRKEAVRVSRRLGLKLFLPYFLGEEATNVTSQDGFEALLSDTYRKGMLGGTGQVSDWKSCRKVRDAIAPRPFILSGGLKPDNVEEAIQQVGPYAVDVSSGVESSPGVKDRTKVVEFVRVAKGAGR